MVALDRVPRACAPGELLSRRLSLPARATLLARDGSVLAERSASTPTGQTETTRTSPLGEAGEPGARHGRADPRRAAGELEAQGVPADADVGLTGVERALDDAPARQPGRRAAGRLAGARLCHAPSCARRSARPSPPRSNAPRSPLSAANTAASWRCSPRPARSSPSPGSAWTASSRRAPRSRW